MGSQVIIFRNMLDISLNLFFALAKCVEIDEMLHSVTNCFVTLDVPKRKPGRVAQSVTCLAIDGSLTADSGVTSLSAPSPILSWRLILK